jgi:hypothetical protein
MCQEGQREIKVVIIIVLKLDSEINPGKAHILKLDLGVDRSKAHVTGREGKPELM